MGRDSVSSSVATLGCPVSFRHRKGSKNTSKTSGEEMEEEVNNDHFGTEEDRSRGPLSVDYSISANESNTNSVSVVWMLAVLYAVYGPEY